MARILFRIGCMSVFALMSLGACAQALTADDGSSPTQPSLIKPAPVSTATARISWNHSAFELVWGGGNTGVKYPAIGWMATHSLRHNRWGAEGIFYFSPRGKVDTPGSYRTIKLFGVGRFYATDTWFLEGGVQLNRSSFQSSVDPTFHFVKSPVYPVVGVGRQWNPWGLGDSRPDLLLRFDWFLQEHRTQNKIQAWRIWSRSDWYPWTRSRVGMRLDVYFQAARSNDSSTQRGNVFEAEMGFGFVFRHSPAAQARAVDKRRPEIAAIAQPKP